MAGDVRAHKLVARLWRDHLHRYSGELLALAPVLLTVAACGTFYAFIVKWATDALQAGDAASLAWAPAAVLVAAALRSMAIWAQAVMGQGLGQKVLRDLQQAMFAKIVRFDFGRHARETSGQLVSRLTNDINVIAESLVRSVQAVLRDALTLIGALIAMVFMDWVLTLLILALFLLTGPALSRIARRARQQTEAQQQTMGRLTALLSEILSSPRLVKTYGLEEAQDARAAVGFEERRKAAMRLVRNRAGVEPLLEMVGGLSLAALLFVAGLRIASDAASLGDLFGMITAVAAASPSARALGTFNTVFNEGLSALARVYALVDEPDAVVDKPDAKPLQVASGRLEFQNVWFAYGETPALLDVSFSVSPGETVAIVGGSGAGKSTVFNLIPRLFDPTQGRVLIDGQDIAGVTLASLRRAIALVSQDATLFDDTIGANIAIGRPGARAADIEAAARAAAAHDFITALPQGYETRVGERGAALSGGERQRVALARAFLRDAPILLLDEATSALDAENEAKIQEALRRLSAGRATLVIAHRLSTIRDATRILVMSAGRIVEQGKHEELMAKGGAYSSLARLQFEPG